MDKGETKRREKKAGSGHRCSDFIPMQKAPHGFYPFTIYW